MATVGESLVHSYEDLLREGTVEHYDSGKHFTERSRDTISLKESMKGFTNRVYLDDHYCTANIKGIYRSGVPVFNKEITFMEKMTARGDVLVEQPYKRSCHAISGYMIAVSKGFAIPKQYQYLCHRVGLIYDKEPYQTYASMLERKLVIQSFEELDQKSLVKELKKFVYNYGVSGISSDGHVKVLDGFAHSESVDKDYLVIRDPLGFQQLIYDIDELVDEHGCDVNYVGKIRYIFSFI